MLTNLNLDDASPAAVLALIDQRDRLIKREGTRAKVTRTHGWMHCKFGSYDVIGVRAEKLLDWRHLECRAAHLKRVHERWSGARWKALDDLWVDARARCLNEVWIFDVRPDRREDVLCFSGIHTCWSTRDELIKEGTQDPSKKGLIVRGNIAREIARLREREHASLTRWLAYDAAFRRAVEARLPALQECRLCHPERGSVLRHRDDSPQRDEVARQGRVPVPVMRPGEIQLGDLIRRAVGTIPAFFAGLDDDWFGRNIDVGNDLSSSSLALVITVATRKGISYACCVTSGPRSIIDWAWAGRFTRVTGP